MSVLSIWTVYDHPRDEPSVFIARRFEIGPGAAVPTSDVVRARTLEGVRALLPPGLALLPRSASDDPYIVESWV